MLQIAAQLRALVVLAMQVVAGLVPPPEVSACSVVERVLERQAARHRLTHP
jgi:hypothetical protein